MHSSSADLPLGRLWLVNTGVGRMIQVCPDTNASRTVKNLPALFLHDLLSKTYQSHHQHLPLPTEAPAI